MAKSKILVWDLPTRLFHWSLAVSFAGAFLTAESERYRDAHVLLGYTVAALLAFRLVWALVGSRYARLRSFAFGPKAVLGYLRSLWAGRPDHYVGHNPAGSWAIFAIVALGVASVASGYAIYADIGGRSLEELHELAANVMLAIVIAHVAGAVLTSVLHRENLIRAMISGYKRGEPSDGIARAHWAPAVALACALALLFGAAVSGLGDSWIASPTQAATHRGADDD